MVFGQVDVRAVLDLIAERARAANNERRSPAQLNQDTRKLELSGYQQSGQLDASVGLKLAGPVERRLPTGHPKD